MKLLNVIDTFCKAKVRHSVQLNDNTKPILGTATLTRKVCIQEQPKNETNGVNGNQNGNEKPTEKSIKVYLKKLADDKMYVKL